MVGAFDQRAVVGGGEHGEAVGPGGVEQVEDGGRGRRVQRGGRLVGEQDRGPHGQRTGQRDPLPLPARQRRRAPSRHVGRQADRAQQPDRLGAGDGGGHAVEPAQRAGDGGPRGAGRIELVDGVLPDQRDDARVCGHPPATAWRNRPVRGCPR